MKTASNTDPTTARLDVGADHASDPSQPADVACKCGALPSADRPGRCARGHALKGAGNTLGRTHGLRASDLGPALMELRDAFMAQSLADDGGAGELSQRRQSLHAYRARLHVHITSLSDAI